jgi:putative transcriptional regulator
MKTRKKLKSWRNRKGLSQSQAARVLGVSVRTLQNWEQGRNVPSADVLLRLLELMEEPA